MSVERYTKNQVTVRIRKQGPNVVSLPQHVNVPNEGGILSFVAAPGDLGSGVYRVSIDGRITDTPELIVRVGGGVVWAIIKPTPVTPSERQYDCFVSELPTYKELKKSSKTGVPSRPGALGAHVIHIP